ncbi:MAG: DinB family protein [Phycisphaeraceae bacterium]|nr:DinB family protein [Phycisphaeraceae bacterium]
MRFDWTLARPILARTPGVLRALLEGLDENWTHLSYGEGTWSAYEVVAHLIHGERTDWLPRLRIILEHGEARPFEPFDRAGHRGEDYGTSLPARLELFSRLRRENIAQVDGLRLTDAQLDRRGVHPALGPVRARELLSTWAVHDLNHIAQCCKATGFQYRDQTGPWEAYLSILSPPDPR